MIPLSSSFTSIRRLFFVSLLISACSIIQLGTSKNYFTLQPPPMESDVFAVVQTGATTNTTAAAHDSFNSTRELPHDRLAIVQKAGMIDLDYVDMKVRYNYTHPHMGARDADGSFGFVYDVTRLSRDINRPALQLNQSVCDILHDDNWHALTKRVRIDWERVHSNALPNVKLLCAVYSTEPYHWKLDAVLETWAPRCDGFFVASNVTDPRYHAVDIPHQGAETYQNMWQKVRSMLCYIYDNYYHDFDWFHVGGDDMWVIVENLRLYLASEEIQLAAHGGKWTRVLENVYQQQQSNQQTPLFLGCRFAEMGDPTRTYVTGGPGYTLNKAALKLLVTQGMHSFADRTKATEDVFVSRILAQLQVEPYPTADNESQRYHHFTPGRHYNRSRPMPKWYRVWTRPFRVKRPGEMHSSIHSVSFHKVNSDNMRRFHAILYYMCASGRDR